MHDKCRPTFPDLGALPLDLAFSVAVGQLIRSMSGKDRLIGERSPGTTSARRKRLARSEMGGELPTYLDFSSPT